MRSIITGIVSFLLIYLIPLTSKFMESAILNFPRNLGAQGIEPAIFKFALALILWGVLYLIFGRKKKN